MITTVQLIETVPDPPEPPMRDAAVQTDSSSILCNETCIARVVQQLLLSDDAAVRFYTGIPTFSRLKAVFIWLLVA